MHGTRKLSRSLCFWMAFLQSVSYFSFLYQSPSSLLCSVFDSISSKIDEVLSINPSDNVFVFEYFNVHHKGWLSYSGGTDRPGEFCYNFSISNELCHIVNFPTLVPDCDSHSPAPLDFFLSSDVSSCSTMAFPPLRNSDHVVISFSIDFPLFHNRMSCFIALLMAILVLIGMVFVIIWEMFYGKISLKVDVFDVFIPHHKYQVKPHSFPWFSAACAGAIVHRNHFFRLHHQNKSSESKVKFIQGSNRYKRVLEATRLYMLLKLKSPSLPRKLAFGKLGSFVELLIVSSTKVNLLYLLYLTAQR